MSGPEAPDEAGVKVSAAKQRLLDAVVDYVARHGVADIRLRQLADAVGTSHRMLIHHFGSKEGLLAEVTRVIEQREQEALARLRADDDDLDVREVVRRFWARGGGEDPTAHERLFFELYSQAVQGREWARPILDGAVDGWVESLSRSLVAAGVAEATAQLDARLAVAVVRGLLLDLLATGDREGVEAALARYEDLYRRAVDGARPAAPRTR
ncbi:MAG TPA: TetR/AcrR family transcriptional regulator [Acidimicrobiales bacterium]